MKTKLYVLGVALMMAIVSVCYGQTCNNHTVTATITDSTTQPWQNGTFTVSIYNPSGGQKPVCRSTGVPITVSYSGAMNAAGILTISLPDTSAVDPSGIQWVFTLQPAASAPAVKMNPVSLTVDTDYSSLFHSQLPNPQVNCLSTCSAYSILELLTPYVPGAVWTNTSVGASPVCNIRTASAWVACGSGTTSVTLTTTGSGKASLTGTVLNIPAGINTGTVNKFAYYATADTILSDSGFFIPLTGSDPPSAGLCTASNQGQEYWASGTLPNAGIRKYTCSTVAGPTRVWIANDSLQWNYVTPTNQPGTTANLVPVSNGSNNSVTWQALPSSGGAVVNLCNLITITNGVCVSGQIRVTGTPTSITFSTIPAYLNYRIIVSASSLATGNDIDLNFNGDVGADYNWIKVSSNNTITNPVISGVGSGDTAIKHICAAAPTAGQFAGGGTIDVQNLNPSNNWVGVTSQCRGQDSALHIFLTNGGGDWNNGQQVTSITLTPESGGAFGTNSTFALYGYQ